MAKLTIKDGSGKERAVLLAGALTMAGRAHTNSIQINDEKSSRQHFKIERRDGGYFAADLDSTNGTKLNGTRLALPTQLRTGDVLSVGKTVLVFEEGDDTAAGLLPVNENEPEISSDEDSERATMVNSSDLKKAIETGKPAAPASGPVYVLKVMEGASPGKIFELGNEPLTLGRHASNTVQIEDEGASNYHAEIAREPAGYVFADLGSTNGTRVRRDCDAEFEKVVKTPLKPGMQIRIGKTLLEFQNIGEEVPEDSMPPNMAALQPQQLDAQLNAAGGGGGGLGLLLKIVLAAAVLAVLVVGGFLIVTFANRGANTTGPKVATTETVKTFANLIPNWSFDQGTDDIGNPMEFTVQPGSPEVVVSVTAAADRQSDKPEAQRHGLQISKGGAKSLLKPTVVETRDPIPVDPAKSYELSAWMRNDDDGIYGMRIVWVDGDRTLAEDPLVFKGQQEWGKEAKTATRTPPPWASHARVGVFVQGKSGKACFDELVFREKSGGAAPRPAPVKNAGIAFQFEGQNGNFSVSSQGKGILEEGTLILEATENKAVSDLSSAYKPVLNKGDEPNSEACAGSIFDFAQQVFATYSVAAKPGASGVDLSAKMALDPDSASKPLLRFYIAGGAALGEIEITKADGAVSRLQATEDKTDSGIKNILFNAGKSPQFNLSMAKTAEVNLKKQGKRRLVEIRFGEALEISMAPEDLAQKQEMLAVSADLNKSVQAKEWGAAQTKMKALVEKYGSRFPQAQEDAGKAKEAVDSAWKSAQAELNQLLATMQAAPSKEFFDKARQTQQRYADAWKDTEQAPVLVDIRNQIDTSADKYLSVDAESKAEALYVKAKQYLDAENYTVAIAYLKNNIIEDAVLGKTKVAEKAKELLTQAETKFNHLKDLNVITDNLLGGVKTLLAAKDYKGAIKNVESEPEYKANKMELKEVNARLEEWKKKAAQ